MHWCYFEFKILPKHTRAPRFRSLRHIFAPLHCASLRGAWLELGVHQGQSVGRSHALSTPAALPVCECERFRNMVYGEGEGGGKSWPPFARSMPAGSFKGTDNPRLPLCLNSRKICHVCFLGMQIRALAPIQVLLHTNDSTLRRLSLLLNSVIHMK